MVDASDYVDGISIRWGRVVTATVGAAALAYFEGIVAVFLSFVDIPLGLLGGLANFGGQLVAVLVGFPTAFVRGSWSGAAAFVLDAGLAGYVVAVAIVLASLYVVAEVYSHV